MMSILGWGLLGVIVLVVVLWFINSKTVKTMFAVTQAHLGEVGRELEAGNALTLMKQGIEQSTEQARRAKAGLVRVQATISGLERQVKAGATEEERVVNRIKKAMIDGMKDTDPILVQMAGGLKTTRDNLSTNQSQLQQAHEIFDSLMGQIQSAQQQGERLEAEAESLGSRLETSKLMAELADFMPDKTAGGKAVDGIGKYKEAVTRQIEANNARMKVNSDLRGPTTAVAAWEQESDAKDILAKIRDEAK